MISDDTEHACMTAQALLAAGHDEEAFARSLAWRMRAWLLALPAAVGWGTLRAIVKLWFGVEPSRSGVRSAGNGACMRAPVLGLCLAHDPARLERFVRASTTLTHRDPRAQEGALVIARAAAEAARGGELGPALVRRMREGIAHADLEGRLFVVERCLQARTSAAEAMRELGLTNGVSGYVLDTVPAALFCWLAHPGDFRAAIEEVVSLGGDADTTAAIVGGLAGISVGASGIPEPWLAGVREWPRSRAWMRRVALRLAARFGHARARPAAARPVPLFWPALPLRNMLFLMIALGHGFRRLLPPY